jgi:hypothetical protein
MSNSKILTLRRDKGYALTYEEMDDNFEYLESKEQIASSLLFSAYPDQNPWINQGNSLFYPGNINIVGNITANTITASVSSSTISANSATISGIITANNYDIGLETLAVNSIALDFSAGTGLLTRAASGAISFTASNYRAGAIKTVRIIAGASTRTLTFPSTWVFVGTKPADILSGKTGILTVTSFGTTEANCVAAWAVSE